MVCACDLMCHRSGGDQLEALAAGAFVNRRRMGRHRNIRSRSSSLSSVEDADGAWLQQLGPNSWQMTVRRWSSSASS